MSVQPPELLRSRAVRSRRAATLPRHNPVDYQTPDSHSVPILDTPVTLDRVPRNNAHNAIDIDDPPSSDRLPIQLVNRSSPESHLPLEADDAKYSLPDNLYQPTPVLLSLPSPIPPVSDSHDLELQIPLETGQQQNSFLDLQDMR